MAGIFPDAQDLGLDRIEPEEDDLGLEPENVEQNGNSKITQLQYYA
jgi:hypothetical protein